MTLAAIETAHNPGLALFKATLDYNARLAELALGMSSSALECALRMWAAQSSSEMADVVTNHTRDQFDAFSEQVEELSALMQKASAPAGEEAEVSLGD